MSSDQIIINSYFIIHNSWTEQLNLLMEKQKMRSSLFQAPDFNRGGIMNYELSITNYGDNTTLVSPNYHS